MKQQKELLTTFKHWKNRIVQEDQWISPRWQVQPARPKDDAKKLQTIRWSATFHKIPQEEDSYDDMKGTQAWQLHKKSIQEGARHIRWELVETSLEGKETVIPKSIYQFQKGSVYQEEEGTFHVPDGYYSGMFQRLVPVGTLYHFRLTNKKKVPFIIQSFYVEFY